MEHELIEAAANLTSDIIPIVPWLDPVTAHAVADITQSLIQHHPEVQAIILFGSVARHDERPLDNLHPSDVDLLFVINAGALAPGAERLTHAQELALHATIGEADYRHRSPREINALFVHRDLAGWDSLFLGNVARDGILLWSRGDLPDALRPIQARANSTR